MWHTSLIVAFRPPLRSTNDDRFLGIKLELNLILIWGSHSFINPDSGTSLFWEMLLRISSFLTFRLFTILIRFFVPLTYFSEFLSYFSGVRIWLSRASSLLPNVNHFCCVVYTNVEHVLFLFTMWHF